MIVNALITLAVFAVVCGVIIAMDIHSEKGIYINKKKEMTMENLVINTIIACATAGIICIAGWWVSQSDKDEKNETRQRTA